MEAMFIELILWGRTQGYTLFNLGMAPLAGLSTHPLARAVTRYGKQQRLEPLELQRFESITGQGLRAARNGRECLLGRRDWLATGTLRVWSSSQRTPKQTTTRLGIRRRRAHHCRT